MHKQWHWKLESACVRRKLPPVWKMTLALIHILKDRSSLLARLEVSPDYFLLLHFISMETRKRSAIFHICAREAKKRCRKICLIHAGIPFSIIRHDFLPAISPLPCNGDLPRLGQASITPFCFCLSSPVSVFVMPVWVGSRNKKGQRCNFPSLLPAPDLCTLMRGKNVTGRHCFSPAIQIGCPQEWIFSWLELEFIWLLDKPLDRRINTHIWNYSGAGTFGANTFIQCLILCEALHLHGLVIRGRLNDFHCHFSRED